LLKVHASIALEQRLSSAADAQALRGALTKLRDRLAGHPAYQPLTEAEEQDIGGDTAELSYLVRVADAALGTDRSEEPK
jgi:hypothetical protein